MALCVNDNMQRANITHTHTHTHTRVCVCMAHVSVCVFIYLLLENKIYITVKARNLIKLIKLSL